MRKLFLIIFPLKSSVFVNQQKSTNKNYLTSGEINNIQKGGNDFSRKCTPLN